MDNEAIHDMFEGLGSVSIRRMFGGKGIYHQGKILALEVDGEILLKARWRECGAFEAAGSTQWVTRARTNRSKCRTGRCLNEALDDPDEMKKWVMLAFEAALRAK